MVRKSRCFVKPTSRTSFGVGRRLSISREKSIGANAGRNSYLRRARAILKYLKNVVKNGCDSARPFHLILKADIESCTRTEMRSELYDEAIEAALKCDMVGYAGVACERAYFALRVRGLEMDELAQRYWDRLMELNEHWGAKAKSEWMVRRYGDLHVDKRGSVVSEVVLKGRDERKTPETKPSISS
uniref:Uncharacterized protein n=1 Tax=Grammatophora oceanica TaxID=210454 RepID=A0A7S1YGD9_9STRA|mmetsp:Transcript_4775/g.6654  ORF Transcript_4775/g.6654 Transcript_4775/m.6654 type:complete len:186 (+) Transcript_4775:347-904(+)